MLHAGHVDVDAVDRFPRGLHFAVEAGEGRADPAVVCGVFEVHGFGHGQGGCGAQELGVGVAVLTVHDHAVVRGEGAFRNAKVFGCRSEEEGAHLTPHGHEGREVRRHGGAAPGDLEAHGGVRIVRVGPGQRHRKALGRHIQAFGDDGGESRGDPLAHLVPGAVEVHRAIGGELQERVGHEVPAFPGHGEARGRAAARERKGYEKTAPGEGTVAEEATAAERAHADTSSAMASVKRASCARVAAALWIAFLMRG